MSPLIFAALLSVAPASSGSASPAPEPMSPAVAKSPRLQRLRGEISGIMEDTKPLLEGLKALRRSYLETPGFWSRTDRREGLRASLQDRIERLVALEDEWNAAIEEHRAQTALAAIEGLMGGGDPARAGADYAFLQGENDFAARSLNFRHSILQEMAEEQSAFEWMRSLQRKRLAWFGVLCVLTGASGAGFFFFAKAKA